MNCKDCCVNERTDICEACKRMQAEGEWKWEIDTGNRMIRCPYCDHGFPIGFYEYKNWHRFCSYCGKQLIKGEQTSMFDGEAKADG